MQEWQPKMNLSGMAGRTFWWSISGARLCLRGKEKWYVMMSQILWTLKALTTSQRRKKFPKIIHRLAKYVIQATLDSRVIIQCPSCKFLLIFKAPHLQAKLSVNYSRWCTINKYSDWTHPSIPGGNPSIPGGRIPFLFFFLNLRSRWGQLDSESPSFSYRISRINQLQLPLTPGWWGISSNKHRQNRPKCRCSYVLSKWRISS